MVTSHLASRVLAILLSAIVLALGIFIADIFFFSPLKEKKKTYTQYSRLLADYMLVIGKKADVEDAKKVAVNADQASARLIVADNRFQAGAALQDIVKKAIYRAGGTLQSVQPLEIPAAGESLQPIIVRADFGLDMKQLPGFLMLMEQTAAPAIWVDHLEVRAPERPESEDPALPVELRLRADISTLMRAKKEEGR